MTQILEVSTAAPSQAAALKLTESAVSAGLAAGGQVTGPIASVFWHQGEFGQGEEWKLTLKTTVERYVDLEAHLIANHEWSNPEVTATPISHASAAYVEWVERVTAQKIGDDG